LPNSVLRLVSHDHAATTTGHVVAGIVAARLARLNLAEAARLATAFSVAALTRREPGPPTHEEIEAMARRVEVESIA
jgi:fructose-1-phosphate kinase PfkB-like protein